MLLDNEPLLRLAVFAGVFTLMALCETIAPKRSQRFARRIRWPGNIGITLLNTLLLRLIFPIAAVGLALHREGQGLLGAININGAFAIVIAILLLDLVIYTQHVTFHRVPLLWKLHRMHHSDNDVDVTTGTRFHPLEMLISMAIKLAAVWVIGAPAIAVLIFEVLLNACALFNHANIALPGGVDRLLRLFIVTPDMHRVHHSIIPAETNSNFGFNLSAWDRLFGTFTDQPQMGHNNMTTGLSETQDIAAQNISNMLKQPFTPSRDLSQ